MGRLRGLELYQVPYIKLAEKYGAGISDYSPEDIITLNKPVEAGTYPKPSGIVSELTRNVHEDSACSACYASLVRALHADKSGRSMSIYIGQGWRGRGSNIPDDALGVGRCCFGAKRHVNGCPPSAKDISEKFAR